MALRSLVFNGNTNAALQFNLKRTFFVLQWHRFKNPFLEKSCFLLQVVLPPLGQTLEVEATRPKQVLKVYIRQVGLKPW